MRDNHPYHQLKGFGKIFIKTLLFCVLFTSSLAVYSQQAEKAVATGIVKDMNGDPVVGAVVRIEGDKVSGAITDEDGRFKINAAVGKTLTFTMMTYKSQSVLIKDQKPLHIVLEEDAASLTGAVVVGFGTQKKESLVSSITTVDVKELKGPTSNLTTMLAGRIAGVIAYQQSGEPGKDNASFFIRGLGTFGSGKQNPLILIDGIESSTDDMARLQPDDIAAFSVLKDATAAAVYGARGANGVLLIVTKEGKAGKTKFNFHMENSFSTNTHNFKFADNITYMNMANEAALTRNPLAGVIYPQSKIDMTKNGGDPYLYPNNDWIKQMIKPFTMNQRFNVNLSGGGKAAQYYIAGTFNIDNGVLKNGAQNSYTSNVSFKNYSIRSNTNLHLTRTTEAIVRVYGQFSDYSGPIGGGGDTFNQVLAANPVAFPATYPMSLVPYVTHPIYGNALYTNGTQLYSNPYANMVSGYQMTNSSTINAQIEVKQDLGFLLTGLSARAMAYTNRYASFASSRQIVPSFYAASQLPGMPMTLTLLNSGSGNSHGTVQDPTLSYSPGNKSLNSAYYGEASVNYDHTFNKKHSVNGMLITTIRNYVNGDAGDLVSSLPSRNVGLSGRFAYDYDHRYLAEFDFGYNGSERFDKGHRFGFFPSVAGGWIMSNEDFFKPLHKKITNLKFRVSYGEVGNDQIGNANDRFFYLSQANIRDGDYSYRFGQNVPLGGGGAYYDGVTVTQYANPNITWELSRQLNLGLDLSVFGFDLTVDAYKQHRTNIYNDRAGIPSTFGKSPNASNLAANLGIVDSKGVDISLQYNKSFANGIWTQSRINFTYATNKIMRKDENLYPANETWRTAVGQNVSQTWGYIAERLFVDDQEAKNSPDQTNVGGNNLYGAGDIKYRDVNGDGKIDNADEVPIGYPNSPEINYGFGGTVGYKQFKFSVFFQGSARSSFFVNPWAVAPFVTNSIDYGRMGGMITQHGLLQQIADSHWSEDNRNLYAFWPRLSDHPIENNNVTSTWWLQNGAFMRLKTIEFDYDLNKDQLKKLGLANMELYVNGMNLFSISKFKMWDPEMGGNGLGYPVQAVYNIGVRFGL